MRDRTQYRRVEIFLHEGLLHRFSANAAQSNLVSGALAAPHGDIAGLGLAPRESVVTGTQAVHR